MEIWLLLENAASATAVGILVEKNYAEYLTVTHSGFILGSC